MISAQPLLGSVKPDILDYKYISILNKIQYNKRYK